ncbi:hypothetical protein [Sphingomonas sp. LHG3406-1]|uniref:hypothetical protein n=1 Tax=Sphingomonas sp. LHG3406-1 TaxID=2804617 RepID=UPI0026313FB8|nr:hypothetical protein [Sphingomonas sp. LHG3406-1]
MTTRLTLVALGAFLSLSACNSADNTIVQQGPADPLANQLAEAPPVELPPSIAASKTYRCDGNKVVEIDWTERNGQPAGANYRVGADTVASTVTTAPAEGTGPYTGADGSSITGTKDASSVQVTLPGQSAITCRG